MAEPFVQRQLRDYAADLASSSFAPGGGSAAALCAALAAALAEMTLRIGGDEAAEAESLRLRLLTLVDEDSAAFAPVAKTWKLPKDNPRRPALLEQAHAEAAQCPLELMELCLRTLTLCERLERTCRELLLADVGSAVALCRGALCAAALNVRTNTCYMKDSSLNEKAAALLRQGTALADGLYARVYTRLEK